MKLAHRCFTSNDARNVETEFVYPLLEVNENNIRKNLESIPPSINDNLTAIPNLTRVAHSWLRQLVLVHLWLRPCLLFSIKYKDIINYPLLSISFSSSEYNQILAKLRRRMAISRRWRLANRLVGVDLDQIP